MSLAPITTFSLYRTTLRRALRPVNDFRQLVRTAVLFVCLAGVAGFVLRADAARAAPAKQAAASHGSFAAFLDGLWPEAQARGVSRETFNDAFSGVTPSPAIMALTRKQAEFVKPVWDYLSSATSASRIEKGTAKAREWSETLQRAESKYGVDPYIVMGVWGMETHYGSFTGDQSTIRALATLAHARYRGDFFRQELLTALQILEEGHVDSATMRGSWAGAMGHTQFMPSSFKKFAVDFDGDGRKNIWASIPDALGSTANYLKQHGWIAGETWGYEVSLPQGFNVSAHGQTNYRGFSSWAREGVTRADGEAMPRSGEAALLLPAGARGPAFLVTRNFKVIKSYNNSMSYALGVALLGDRIAGAGPLKGRWPVHERPLNSAQAKELQVRLQKMGHDIGNLDGKLGEKASIAIRSYQQQAGLEADGYPTLRLLERMRKSQ